MFPQNLTNFELRVSTLNGEKDLLIILPFGYGLHDSAPSGKLFKCTGLSRIHYCATTPYEAISTVMSEERVSKSQKLEYFVELVHKQ